MPTVIDPGGRSYDVPDEQLSAYLSSGFRIESHGERAERNLATVNEEQYGGVAGGVAAATLGALGAVTGGLSDVAISGIGGDEALRQLHKFHPIASTVGSVAGAFVPTGFGGLASKLGTNVTEGLGGGLLARTIGGVAEGSAFGLQQGVSDLATSQDPLTFERAAGTISSNMLYGGAAGGAFTGALSLVDRGLAKAGTAIDDGAAAMRDIKNADVATLDARGLKKAEQAELESIDAMRHLDRETFVNKLRDHDVATQVEDLFKATSENPNKVVRQLGKDAREADIKIQGLLKNEAGLARDPGKALDALERQAQSLAKIESEGLAEYAKITRDFDKGPRLIKKEIATASDSIRKTLTEQAERTKSPFYEGGLEKATNRQLARKYGVEAGDNLTDRIVNSEMMKRFGTADTNPVLPKYLQSIIDNTGIARARNAELRSSLEQLTSAPSSARLTEIQAAKDALGMPKQESLGSMALHAVAKFGGPLTTAAKYGSKLLGGVSKMSNAAQKFTSAALGVSRAVPLIGLKASDITNNAVYGRMNKAIATDADRTGSAVKAFSGSTEHAVKYAPISASTVMHEIRYGSKGSEEKDTLPAMYHARSEEIRRQTAYDATGIPRIRPEARQAIADKLKPVMVVNPVLGDRLETLAVRRLEYLSSILPRRPDLGGIPGPWQPSDMQIRSFARSMSAVEDPSGIEERAVHGAITPEEAAAYWAVYPERAQHFQSQILASASALPYHRRLALGIFTRSQVDPAMNPAIMAVLQGQFVSEPDTAGGIQAPTPKAQYGAIKKSIDEGTAAQHRSQGARI